LLYEKLHIANSARSSQIQRPGNILGQSKEHLQIKEKIQSKTAKWYGSSLSEYYDSGHIDDVCCIVNKKKILVEIIWDATRENFYRDMNLVQTSDATIKLVVVNPEFLMEPKFETLRKEFTKTKMAMEKRGERVSELINGTSILANEEFLDVDFRQILETMLKMASGLNLIFDPKNPQLLGYYEYEGSNPPLRRKVARLEVWNSSDETATKVHARIEVLEGPKRPRPAKLHFAYTSEFPPEPELVDILRNDHRILDLVFSQPRKAIEAPSQPKVTSATAQPSSASFGSYQSSGASSMFQTLPPSGTQSPLASGTPSHLMRADLTESLETHLESSAEPTSTIAKPYDVLPEGAYLATTEALRNPLAFPQYHLPAGTYLVRVEVACDNLTSAFKTYRIKSSLSPDDLIMEEV
jgi:hypothetical protein